MKKTIIIAISVVLVVLAGYLIFNFNQGNPEIVLKDFFAKINEGQYEEMYELLSEESKAKITKEDFVKRNKNIYQGIDLVSIEISKNELKFESPRKVKISYSEIMRLEKAEISMENSAYLVKEEGEYKVNWSSNLIFPSLNDQDKVKVSTSTNAKRGRLLDRNGLALAENRKSIICWDCASQI